MGVGSRVQRLFASADELLLGSGESFSGPSLASPLIAAHRASLQEEDPPSLPPRQSPPQCLQGEAMGAEGCRVGYGSLLLLQAPYNIPFHCWGLMGI